MSIAIDEILIQVPREVAETYRQATVETRQQMAQQIGIIFDVFSPEISADLVSFKNLLLDAIERSHPRYHEEIQDALTNALTNALTIETPTMSASEFGEWLSRV
jgi:hypothetical protein